MNVKIPLLTLQFPSAKGLARIPKKRSASHMTPGIKKREEREGGREGEREGEREGGREREREQGIQGDLTVLKELNACTGY